MNKTNSTFEAMLKAAISRDSTGATDTMLIHAHLAQMKMFGIVRVLSSILNKITSDHRDMILYNR